VFLNNYPVNPKIGAFLIFSATFLMWNVVMRFAPLFIPEFCKKTCEEIQQALVELIVLKTLCLEQTQETPITKVITMKTKITLAAALVMTAFSFFSTAPAQASAFVKLGDIAAEMLWMKLLESDPDRSSSYNEVECVYMTLRGIGFDDDEAIMGLVLMSEGFTLDETIRCLTSENSIATPNYPVDRSSGQVNPQSTENLSQGALR
jgi:hypothetical protein